MTARIDAAIDAAAERFEESTDVTGYDIIVELREAAAALRAEVATGIARAIQAACPVHATRDYTPVDSAYDNAARIAREQGAL